MLLLNTFVFATERQLLCLLNGGQSQDSIFSSVYTNYFSIFPVTHVCSFINFAASKFTEFIYISYWELHDITFDLADNKPEKGAKPKSTNSESETEAVHSSRIQHCDINFSFTASLTEWLKIFLLSL